MNVVEAEIEAYGPDSEKEGIMDDYHPDIMEDFDLFQVRYWQVWLPLTMTLTGILQLMIFSAKNTGFHSCRKSRSICYPFKPQCVFSSSKETATQMGQNRIC